MKEIKHIGNFISSFSSGTVINYGSGSDSDFLTSYGSGSNSFFLNIFLGDFFFSYCIQHCFICRPSDSTVPTDAGIESRTVATGALAVRCSNH
jgi:hypothetical protein